MRISEQHPSYDPASPPVPLATTQPDAGAAAPGPPPSDTSAAPHDAAAYGARRGLDWYETYGRATSAAPPPSSHQAVSSKPLPVVKPTGTSFVEPPTTTLDTPSDMPAPSSNATAGERTLHDERVAAGGCRRWRS